MLKYTIYIIVSVILCSCGSATRVGVSTLDTIYYPRYASHFVVLAAGDTTILRVRNPWQGAAEVEYDYKFIDSNPRMVTMSSSHSAFVEALGADDHIVGVSGARYLTSDKMRSLPDVGYDNNMNFELLVALQPDIVTIYEISGENSTTTQKMEALGLHTVYIADYLEDSPLAKAEWVVAFGAIVGKVDTAVEIFAAVEQRYNAIKDSVQRAALRPVRVMFNSPYRDVWYLPSDSSYMVRMVQDAGGQYVAAGTPGNVSRAVSVELAYTLLQKAEMWLNPSAHITSQKQLKMENPLLKNINIPIFSNNKRGVEYGGSDFWESGTVHPDVALEDLVKILHPELLPNHELYYHQRVQ